MDTVTFPGVISRGCGIDIHKKVVAATIDGSGLRQKTREFNIFTSSLTSLKDWLLGQMALPMLPLAAKRQRL